MFESLTSRFEGILRNIRGKGRLGPEEVEEVLEEIRVALLEADVHLGVVRTLQDRIRERAVGEELAGVLNPGQQVVKIVLEHSDISWLALLLGDPIASTAGQASASPPSEPG